MAKILNPVSNNAQLELSRLLQVLLDAAEQGEWDSIESMTETLLPALEAVRQPFENSASSPVDRSAVTKNLDLLKQAIERCATRKEQIGPLLAALSSPQARTDE